MHNIKNYHRPETVEAVLELLNRGDVKTAVLAGGTHLVSHLDETVEELVDLQAVGLTQVRHTGSRLTLGAMVRLQTVVEDDKAPDLLRQMALLEGANTFRHVATIGGVVAGADPESELLAALLVMETAVEVQTLQGTHWLPLADLLADLPAHLKGGLITAVSLHKNGRTAHARVARTPKDKPIVAALARRHEDQTWLAVCGVAATPLLLNSADIPHLHPPADFRGSTAYRRQMAELLSKRALAEVGN